MVHLILVVHIVLMILTNSMQIFRHIDDTHVNGNGISSGYNSIASEQQQEYNDVASLAHSKSRSVSMFETRDGSHPLKPVQNHENRTANSMYQMVDGQLQPNERNKPEDIRAPVNGTLPPNILPRSEDVKYRTEIVTRRIQELWSVMQEMNSSDVFVPGAEKVAVAVAELTALFSMVICCCCMFAVVRYRK